jgi:hypothetical protein
MYGNCIQKFTIEVEQENGYEYKTNILRRKKKPVKKKVTLELTDEQLEKIKEIINE